VEEKKGELSKRTEEMKVRSPKNGDQEKKALRRMIKVNAQKGVTQ